MAQLPPDPQSCSLLPASLQWLVQQAPVFPLHSHQVRIITDPSEFYHVLKDKVSHAESRITLSSLYLGNGKLEQDLVEAVDARLSSQPALKVLWLLDYTRGSRTPLSSRHMLVPLLRHGHCQVSLFHTPELRGLLKQLLPQRWNEVVGLQHMKLYIFDDDILISGSNLSADYFTNRQDRYILLTGVRELADFFQAIVGAVSGHSLLLRDDDTTALHPTAVHHPYTGNYTAYCKAVEGSIRAVWDQAMRDSVGRLASLNTAIGQWQDCAAGGGVHRRDTGKAVQAQGAQPGALSQGAAIVRRSLHSSSVAPRDDPTQKHLHSRESHEGKGPEDTLVFPTLQMKSFNINYDEAVTKRLLTSAVPGSTVHLASGYFNLTKQYMDRVLTGTKARFDILSAHPKANGFLGAAGVSGEIPSVYTHLARQFLSRVGQLQQGHRVRLWEYQREGWTFHGKGLWYSPPPPGPATATATAAALLPCLSLIGSPNFGWRSVNRDLESQLVLVTTNQELREALGAEQQHLFSSSSLVHAEETFSHTDRYVKLWVRFVIPIIKKFF